MPGCGTIQGMERVCGVAWGRLVIALLLGTAIALRYPQVPGITALLAQWDRVHPSVAVRGALILFAEPPIRPDPACPILGALERGRMVRVQERRPDGWVAVRAAASGTVWVPDRPWLPPVDRETPLAMPLPAYAAPAAPPANGAPCAVRVIDAGAQVRVLRRGPAWSLVRFNGVTGWVTTAGLDEP